jgi:hypothetical protein
MHGIYGRFSKTGTALETHTAFMVKGFKEQQKKYKIDREIHDFFGRVRFPAGAGKFSLHHRVQNGSGAHPASYPTGTRGYFLRG